MKNIIHCKLLIFNILLFLMPVFGWAQTDFSGIWYIASNGNSNPSGYTYNSTTPANNYYLRPAADPQQTNNIDAYWYPIGNEAGNNSEKPFLTTNKTGHADLALWVVVKTGDYYLIKHAATGKYVKCEPCITGTPGDNNNSRRKTMHLEVCSGTPTDDAFKFKIDYFNSGEEICIVPKIVEGKTFKYWNIADKNQPFNNGQGSSLYYGGLIGLYSLNNTSLDINSKWRFEHAINPVITYDYLTNSVSIGNPLTSSYNDIHFYYTTDGNTPTSSSTEYTTPFEPSSACTVKAIAVRGTQTSDVISLALSQVATPTVSIDAATYEVTISGDGDAYYYTTDGTDPIVGTNAYTGPFALDYADAGKTIKAIAVKANMVPSAVGSAVATFQCKAPVISFNNTTQKVVITCEDNKAAIFYTTNEDDPTTGSTAYTAPFTLSSPTTVKARAFHTPNYTDSKITSMVLSQVETPALTVTSNRIYITCATPGATIYYTTDGSEPNPNYSSHLYNNNPLTCSGVTIKAIALKSSMLPSTLFEGSETLTCDPPVIARTDVTHFSITATFPSPDAAVTLYYTTGSGDPDTEYTTPVAFTGTITVKAQATATGFDPSAIVETSFNSNGLPGGGTSADPYVINDDFSFSYFLSHPSNGYYQLTKDVNAPGSMSSIATFSGTLEGVADAKGNFPVISGLTQPLFISIDGGTVKNVMLSEVNINLSSGNAGAITKELRGTSDNMGIIYNCGILSGSVGSSNNNTIVGGLVGVLGVNNSSDNCYARVINCFSYATITGGRYVGGIVGYNYHQTTASDIRTMVMNCMFYGDITDGTTVAPIYGGYNINNLQGGLNTFNYYAYDKLKTKAITSGKYNCALAVEEKYLNRFEFYRLLLNSNKKLAAFYITGDADDANLLAKWVLETADRTIANPKPYPVLKAQGYYPSIINPDMANAPDSTTVGPNKGGKLGKTLSVTISGVGSDAPTGAGITTNSLTLQRTDKDFDRFNFNYDKVQLPYYNDVGTGNYTENRVVTGWKITAITTLDDDPYTTTNYDYTQTYASNQDYFDYPNYNFADRKSSNKDLYSVSGRVFSQGAYFDVPYGVTEITIEPYWAKAWYIADPNYDVVYYKTTNDYDTKQNVTQMGTQVNTQGSNPTLFNGQKVETSITRSLDSIASSLGGLGSTVYDNALVLVGNLHLNTVPLNGDRPFTMMSVDTDHDHEPDYSLIYHHKNRSNITPIRFDFLNIPGTAQAQKPNGAELICNFTIFKTRGWFEVTNTAFMYSSQIEYENGDLGKDDNGVAYTKINAPLILLGGIFDQFVSTQSSTVNGRTIYIHVGGNVWINSFGLGTHSDGSKATPHVPVSVTGGEFMGFYLTGTYNANAVEKTDNAECYISGGYFHEAAGAAQEPINGNVQWQIYNADIDNFFGGGTNDAKPIKGDVTVDIYNSHVTTYCGGPKFGNMQNNKKVTTNAEGCIFDKFFGAGYGGLSYSRKKYYDKDGSQDWATLQGYFTGDRGKYFDGENTPSSQISGKDYGKKGPGVATDFDYEFFVWSSGTTGARFFVKFASFSTAQCNDVKSTLTRCTVNGDFFGGGSLGKVIGTATSVLDSCIVKGNVYGAGYSASLEPIEVRDAGFALNGSGSYLFPNFNKSSGMFEEGTFSGTTTFQWEEGTFPSDDNDDPEFVNNKVTTEVDLDDLGSVKQVDLTITGNSAIGTPGAPDKGHVFGGGDESMVTENTLVKILGHIKVYGNIYGGGNQGEVQGNTKVIMNGKIN